MTERLSIILLVTVVAISSAAGGYFAGKATVLERIIADTENVYSLREIE